MVLFPKGSWFWCITFIIFPVSSPVWSVGLVIRDHRTQGLGLALVKSFYSILLISLRPAASFTALFVHFSLPNIFHICPLSIQCSRNIIFTLSVCLIIAASLWLGPVPLSLAERPLSLSCSGCPFTLCGLWGSSSVQLQRTRGFIVSPLLSPGQIVGGLIKSRSGFRPGSQPWLCCSELRNLGEVTYFLWTSVFTYANRHYSQVIRVK